jgi:hypothetical protein
VCFPTCAVVASSSSAWAVIAVKTSEATRVTSRPPRRDRTAPARRCGDPGPVRLAVRVWWEDRGDGIVQPGFELPVPFVGFPDGQAEDRGDLFQPHG